MLRCEGMRTNNHYFNNVYEAHRLDAVKLVKFCPDNETFVVL